MRKCIELSKEKSIIFLIDKENADEIKNFLQEKGINKIKFIFRKIIDRTVTKDEYSKEEYASSIKGVTAIKLKGKAYSNARIYCKDYIKDNKRKIILCCLLKSKKQNELTPKEKNLIKKTNRYQYE